MGESLSLTGVANGAASVRRSAAALAVRAARPAAAEQHVRRARELIPELDVRPGLCAPPILAEVMIAQRRETDALRMLLRTMPSQAVDSRILDDMVLWGTRAAADVADRARDRSDAGTAADALALLDALEELRARLPGEPYAPGSAVDRRHPAIGLVVAVERERTRGPVPVARWLEAAAACGAAELRWEQHRALLMAATVSVRAGADRATTARLLREVHAYARAEQAVTLGARAEELARISRVPLAEPRLPAQPSGRGAGRLDGLTRREREVLGHLVAGRTYAEIASALFVTEKTVSTHVSHLLRKTGTSSRHEVAALALRLGAEV